MFYIIWREAVRLWSKDSALLWPLHRLMTFKINFCRIIMELREEPFRRTGPTVGHCPNSDWTPPTHPGTLGHFFPGQFEHIRKITILTVHKCHKASWKALTQANAYAMSKCRACHPTALIWSSQPTNGIKKISSGHSLTQLGKITSMFAMPSCILPLNWNHFLALKNVGLIANTMWWHQWFIATTVSFLAIVFFFSHTLHRHTRRTSLKITENNICFNTAAALWWQ